MRNPISTTMCSALLAVLLAAGGARAQETEPAAQPDEPAPSLDELLGLETDDSEATAAEQARRESAEELQRQLSEIDISDVFVLALEKMALSAHLLDVELQSGLATQRAQLDALDKLDQLIDKAKQLSSRHPSNCSGCSSCSGGKSGSKPKPGSKPGAQAQGSNRSQSPATDSQAADAPPRRDGDINTVLEETGTEWGHLPARVREQLLQGRGDFHSRLYRKLTEEYYKRLAEEGSS